MTTEIAGSSRVRRRAIVKSNTTITPRMQRIVFGGVGLEGFTTVAPAQWVKLFFPGESAEHDSVGRAYTIRRFDRGRTELTVDFFLHEGGIGSAWARTAMPETEIELVGPKSEFRIDQTASWYLLAGDETAIPGICAILESLPVQRKAVVVIEVHDATDELEVISKADVQTLWLHRASTNAPVTQLIGSTFRTLQLPPSIGQVWLAGEAESIRFARSVLLSEKEIQRSSIHSSGYWKRGRTNHKDDESDY